MNSADDDQISDITSDEEYDDIDSDDVDSEDLDEDILMRDADESNGRELSQQQDFVQL